MWRDHLFSQRNKTTKRAVGLQVGGDGEGGFGQGRKRKNEGVGNISEFFVKLD